VGKRQSHQAERGIAAAVGAALLFGANPSISKVVLDRVEPLMLAGLFYVGAGLGLTIIYLFSRRLTRLSSQQAMSVRGKDWLWLGAATLFGGVMAPVLLMFGIADSPASSASLLLSLEGVFTALLGWFIFRERFNWGVALGMSAIIAGSMVLSWAKYSEFGVSWGSLAVIGSCFAWACDNNLTKQISHREPLQISAVKSGVAGVVNTAIALSMGQSLPSPPLLVVTGAIGLLNYGLALVCFVLALRYIGAARTGAYFSLAPFIGAAIAILVLGEGITRPLIVATGLMILGVGLCLSEQLYNNLQNTSPRKSGKEPPDSPPRKPG
jgi:drug/metabolite transporter (DMT)-like permease